MIFDCPGYKSPAGWKSRLVTVSAGRYRTVLSLLAILLIVQPIAADPEQASQKPGSAGDLEIAGTIVIGTRRAPVLVYLIQAQHLSTPGTGLCLQKILPESGQNLVYFHFSGLASDRYAIRVFQDTNGNEVLDSGLFGPLEPWALSWQTKTRRMPPRFEDISFRLDTDVNLQLSLVE
ncbi:DUF2141 domain-containing protein [Patescibacteria group bacterium]|nr:DUF2141 domain-containing protein [Patescibacteria group bacterium]